MKNLISFQKFVIKKKTYTTDLNGKYVLAAFCFKKYNTLPRTKKFWHKEASSNRTSTLNSICDNHFTFRQTVKSINQKKLN